MINVRMLRLDMETTAWYFYESIVLKISKYKMSLE